MSHFDRQCCRHWIRRSLWTGVALTIVTVVAGLLWAILSTARDVAGSAGAKGVFLTSLVLWGINFVALVVFTALCQIVESDE